jgi:hypothetical protein
MEGNLEYFLWRSDRGEEFCVIEEPDISKSWELTKGMPRLETLSSPIPCKMNPAFRKEVRLSDNLYGASVPVISRRTREVLEASTTNRVEFLPARITNHKRRVEPEEYFVLHPLDMVECIDTEASGVEWNRISPDRISRCRTLVLREDAIPADFKIFRLAHWGSSIIVRQDLAESLQGAGLTGLSFRPTEGYTGIG